MRTLPVAVLIALSSLTAHAELTAGAAARSIVPPFPTHMGGFGDRMETFTGAHDPLFARALVLDNGDTQLVVIGSGLMALDAELTGLVRDRIEEATGIPPQNIMVSCVHNHSAPSYYQYQTDEEKAPMRDFLVDQFSGAAIEAYESRVPAELGYRAGEITDMTSNRQQGNEEVIDTTVGVVRVETLEGRDIIATLFNFTGHPVIIGSENLLLSGEFPGAACRTVESVLGGVAIMTQGACGDVTVKRHGDPFLEIERFGRAVAGEVIKTAELIQPSADVKLAAASEQLLLPRKALPTVEDGRAAMEKENERLKAAQAAKAPPEIIRHHERRLRLLDALFRQARAEADGTLTLEDEYEASIQTMQIGDVVLVAIPGELFVEYALELRQRVAQLVGKGAMLVGYANGYIGYIVTPRAIETGGYEASVARVHHTAGRTMTERAIQQICDTLVAPATN